LLVAEVQEAQQQAAPVRPQEKQAQMEQLQQGALEVVLLALQVEALAEV
tara:strand:+ start:270 stop:416 length:147 start_codon:yes stop_codon:yes gene_type:complete